MSRPKGFGKLDGRIDDLTSRYERVEARLASLIARTVAAGTLGNAAVRRAVKAEVRLLLSDLNKKAIPEGKMIVDQAYELGRLIASIEGKGGRLDDTALAMLKDNLAGRLGDATTHVGRRTDDVFRKEGLRVASQVIAGEDQDEAIAGFERRLNKKGVTGFTDVSGKQWQLSTYARMAVKTTAAEAVFYGTRTTLLQADLDLVVINKSAKCCDLCSRYDGNIYSLTGRDKRYPVLDVVFPLHPLCNHYISPAPGAFEERAAAA